MRLPAGLEWWRDEPGGAAWLERLPRVVAECADLWSLRLGAAFEAHVSFVAPAELSDGRRAVLKVNFPEPESEREPDALLHWDGESAVRLLAHDPGRRALLVERCEPGTQLWQVVDEEEANGTAAALLRRLWRPLREEHELVKDPGARARVRRRLDGLAAELELDRERMRGWGLAHALAWNGDEGMIACARWLAAAR